MLGYGDRSRQSMVRVEEASLRRLVGGATLTRGRSYARAGAVVRRQWDADRSVVEGEVRGAAPEPYRVRVAVRRSAPDASIAHLDGRCSCPVGFNCKHAVALLLAPDPPVARPRPPLEVVRSEPESAEPESAEPESFVPASPEPDGFVPASPGQARSGRRSGPAWDATLAALLAAPAPAGGPVAGGGPQPAVGLQLEVARPRPIPSWRKLPPAPGVGLRPVLPGAVPGRWVRTGIAWSRLDSFGFGRPEAGPALALLRELLALSVLGGRAGYGYGYGTSAETIWLEDISSRRVWDLLAQASEVGLALVGAGRMASPVVLASRPAEALIDLTRAGSGLQLRARLRAGEDEIDPGQLVWIGSPPHGVVWWPEGVESTAAPALHLAPLSHPLDPGLAELLRADPIEVPAAETARFQSEIYPKLRRRVMFDSTDGSVELVDLPDTLVLTLSPGDGTLVELSWSLRSGGGELRSIWDEPDEIAAAALDSARAVLRATTSLVMVTPWGEQLASRSRLEGMDAARFVAEVLPRLGAIPDLEVVLAGELPEYREATDAPVVRLGGEESTDGDWFDLLVEVEVGGEEVPFHELFRALAAEESHLLLPSGTYFALDRPELRQLAELIAEARSLQDAPRDGVVRLGRFQASLWEELVALGIVTAQAGAWADAVAALAGVGDETDRPLPAGLHAALRPYQEEGFQWLASRYEHRLGGILADDMGLGKTLEALALVCHAREQRREAPWLVVAPTSVVGNWVAEAARFAPGVPTVAITETERRRGTPLAEAVAGAGLVVTSYTLFRLEYDDYEAIPWAGMMLDEAQFAKNPASHNYQRARRLPAEFKLAMTGTPLENSLTELWALSSITAPGLFARPDRFAETYRVPIERHGDGERLEQLRRRIKPVMLRRTKEQVASDLPDKQEQVLELDLHPRHRKLYQTYLARERQKVLGLLEDVVAHRFEIFRSLTLLRQAALDVTLVDPAHAGVPSTKLDVLTDMLAEVVADGHRVLVFSQFTRYLGEARRRVEAAGIDCCYLDGKTRNRGEVIAGFREGSAPVFMVSLKAGGFGLNLTEADYCILLDPWWNPATEAQAVDRVHRIGQTRKVMVYRLVARDTIEEKVMALKARKAALFDSVVGGGGFESGALRAEDVRALLE